MATKKKTGFDLSDIAPANDTAKIELYHPSTGETLTDDSGNPMWIEVYGPESAHSRDVSKQFLNRHLQRAQRSGKMSLNMSADELEAQGLEALAKNIKGWHVVLNGSTPDCNEASAKDLLTDYPWIREQIEAGRDTRANFMKS